MIEEIHTEDEVDINAITVHYLYTRLSCFKLFVSSEEMKRAVNPETGSNKGMSVVRGTEGHMSIVRFDRNI